MAHTIDDVVLTALRRANVDSPSATHIARAREWVREILADLLQAKVNLDINDLSAVYSFSDSAREFTLPAGFKAVKTLYYLTEHKRFTATGLSSTPTITTLFLPDGHGILVGEKVLVNGATAIATVTNLFAGGIDLTPPTGTQLTGFVILDYLPIGSMRENRTESRLDAMGYEIFNNAIIPVGTPKTGGLLLNYSIDLTTLDPTLLTTPTALDSLLHKYENIFVEGIRAKELQRTGEDEFDASFKIYRGLIAGVVQTPVERMAYSDV